MFNFSDPKSVIAFKFPPVKIFHSPVLNSDAPPIKRNLTRDFTGLKCYCGNITLVSIDQVLFALHDLKYYCLMPGLSCLEVHRNVHVNLWNCVLNCDLCL